MYASSTFFTAILALAHIAVAATPPACLIAAMGAQSNPADLKALCGSLESQVYGNITEKCSGSAESAAISVYSATCLASASVTISIPSSTSSSASTTGTGKTSTTGTASGSATGSSTAKATGSGSSSTGTATGTAASATGTNSAGSNSPQFAVVLLAAGFLGQYLL
ncbi:uncharacterized protein PAC_09583 [Phialocephala subalpina]|uniref:Extracellular membrane protein CFEM domain-containing protein n=1 Tax=Phialocephala subalpina TaxID=576137 RepID=A0A1L7X3U8_9HELO|nr:uncharacterized protein PAC_09583 [Phialocephala subalpina]